MRLLISLFTLLGALQTYGQDQSESSDSLWLHVDEPRLFYADKPLITAEQGTHIDCIRMFNRWGELLVEFDDPHSIVENHLKYDQLNFGEFYVFLITGIDENGEDIKFTMALQFYGYSQCG